MYAQFRRLECSVLFVKIPAKIGIFSDKRLPSDVLTNLALRRSSRDKHWGSVLISRAKSKGTWCYLKILIENTYHIVLTLCVCERECVCVCVRVCVSERECVCDGVGVWVYLSLCLWVYVSMYMCVYVYICACICEYCRCPTHSTSPQTSTTKTDQTACMCVAFFFPPLIANFYSFSLVLFCVYCMILSYWKMPLSSHICLSYWKMPWFLCVATCMCWPPNPPDFSQPNACWTPFTATYTKAISAYVCVRVWVWVWVCVRCLGF